MGKQRTAKNTRNQQTPIKNTSTTETHQKKPNNNRREHTTQKTSKGHTRKENTGNVRDCETKHANNSYITSRNQRQTPETKQKHHEHIFNHLELTENHKQI